MSTQQRHELVLRHVDALVMYHQNSTEENRQIVIYLHNLLLNS